MPLIAVAILPIWSVAVQVLPMPRPAGEGAIGVVDLTSGIAGEGAQRWVREASTYSGSLSAGTAISASAIPSLLFMAWIIGALVMLIRFVRNTVHLHGIRREAQPIAGTEGAASPFFSPDGAWIGYYAGWSLAKVAVAATGLGRHCARAATLRTHTAARSTAIFTESKSDFRTTA